MGNYFKKNSYLLSIIIAICVAYGVAFLSIYFLGEYGWTIFVVVPFLLGIIPPIIHAKFYKLSASEINKMSFASLGTFCFTTLLFAFEGIICILMASPILLLFTFLGALAAKSIIDRYPNPSKNALSLLILPIFFLALDHSLDTTEYLEVKTSININAPAEKVWDNIISFGEIKPPAEWLFKTGIAYPTHATIEGHGEGAIRYCNFTTGSFVEPITKWDAPTILQFDVLEQPTPMRELNPFWDVHPPHLNGYFQSIKGQFELIPSADGSIQLTGTTWYNIHIHPVSYWDFWSKIILHKIHFRVLEHIKLQSEI